MKQLIIVLALNFLCVNLAISQSEFSKYYSKYKEKEGVESFEISSSFFKFLLDNRDEKVEQSASKIDVVSFLIADSINPKLSKEMVKNIPSKKYEPIFEVKDGNSVVSFQAKGSRKKIKEIMLTVIDTNSVFVMCIAGEFDMDEAKKLAKSVNIDKVKVNN